MDSDPYFGLIVDQARRADEDLASFRSRALAVVTTSSAIVSLLTAAITFGASKSEEDSGIPGLPIVLFSVSLAAFVLAAALAVHANRAGDIDRVPASQLIERSKAGTWSGSDAAQLREREREVAHVLAKYLQSVRVLADNTASELNRAIRWLIVGLVFASIASIATVAMI